MVDMKTNRTVSLEPSKLSGQYDNEPHQRHQPTAGVDLFDHQRPSEPASKGCARFTQTVQIYLC
jgi:hypothetical protein